MDNEFLGYFLFSFSYGWINKNVREVGVKVLGDVEVVCFVVKWFFICYYFVYEFLEFVK